MSDPPRGPSRTAAYVALFRALETRLPPEKRLFSDPYAEGFLDRRLGAALAMARAPLGGGLVADYIDRTSPGARVSVIVRTRFIDEAMREALADGIGQVVILGAGFDTRAHRIEGAAGARVFEVDEPATLAEKRERIERLLGAPPAHVTPVPVDFERDDLATALRSAGLDPGARALFIWEGVASYLSAEAVDGTLRALAGLGAPGSLLVFTYLDRAGLEDGAKLRGAKGTIGAVRRAGEPFRFGLDPAELGAYLAERGLELREEVSTAELAERYLHPRGRRPVASEFFRLAVAVRPGEGKRR